MTTELKNRYTEEELQTLYATKQFSDCTFIFGEQKIPAHKSILTCESPIFHLMFFGSLPADEIQINDIDADDFQQVLEFVYTKKLKINSIHNAWSLYYISQKYFINDLKTICTEYIYFNVTLSTLLLSYEYAELYNLDELAFKCWRDILVTATETLVMDYHMMASTFCALLEENYINASEEDLIKAAMKWAKEECNLKKLEPTKENKCDLLIKAGIFSKLRFYSLDKDCNNYLNQLVAEDYKKESHCASLICPYTFSRERMPFGIKSKFRENYKIERNITISNKNEFHCTVTSTKRIVVYSVGVTPPHQDGFVTASSKVIIMICDIGGKSLSSVSENIRVSNEYEIPRLITLPQAFTLEANIPYKICVQFIPHSGTYKPLELLCYYLSNNIKSHTKNITISFKDEKCGGIIRGFSYYVV